MTASSLHPASSSPGSRRKAQPAQAPATPVDRPAAGSAGQPMAGQPTASQPISGQPMPGQWLNVMVEFARTPLADEQNLTRGELYRRRRADAQGHRQALEAWLQREGLAGGVKDFGEVTAFDLLFATVTPQVAAALRHAPDVVAVMPAD